MPGTETVELLRGNQSPRRFGSLNIWGFPEIYPTFQQIYDYVEPRLSNEEQKNAVKAVLNAAGDSEANNNELGFQAFEVLQDLAQFYKMSDTMTVADLMKNLQIRINTAIDSNPKKERPNLKIALENINNDPEKVRTTSGKPGKTDEKKEAVSWNELQKRETSSTMVQLLKAESSIDMDDLGLYLDSNERNLFPKSEYTARHIYNMIEGKLKNDDQKNAVRELLNQFTSTIVPDRIILPNFIKHSNALMKGELTADSYMDKLLLQLRSLGSSDQKNLHLQNARKYILKDTRRADAEKKTAVKKLVNDLTSSAIPDTFWETPDVNSVSVKFFNDTLQTATSVKGKWKDSREYMNFYVTLRSAGEMMSVLYDAKQNEKDTVALDPRKLSVNTQSILKSYYSDGKIRISTEQLQKAYESTYKNIKRHAAVYENYKHRTKSAQKYNSNDIGKLNVTRFFTGSPIVGMPSKGRKNNL